MNNIKLIGTMALVGALSTLSAGVVAKNRDSGRGTGPVVFVTSQQLYYDSIVVVDPLPAKGRFQQLVPTMTGLTTEFGPGEVGHLGGRWWIDVNGNEEMDDDDMYFLCPLLGPGRETM